MNAEKLLKLQAQVRIGGKGSQRRKTKKVHHAPQTDDKNLQAALKKLNVQPVAGVEEVNFFCSDGSVLHFVLPKVTASVASNTFVVGGLPTHMTMTQIICENPALLAQLGAGVPNAKPAVRSTDDDIPELVDFEAVDDDVPQLVEVEDVE